MAKKLLPGLAPLRKLIADLIKVSITTLGDIPNTPEAEAHEELKKKPALRRELELLLAKRVYDEILPEEPALEFIDRRRITNEELYGDEGRSNSPWNPTSKKEIHVPSFNDVDIPKVRLPSMHPRDILNHYVINSSPKQILISSNATYAVTTTK